MSSHYFQIPARKLKQSPPPSSSHAPPPPPPPPPMYPYHSPSSLTLRAKLSFHHISPYNNNDTSTTYCYASHSQSQSPTPNLYAAAANRNPRFLYYGYLLRSHSALFQFQPLTTLLIPRRAARVYYESAAAEEERRCCCCCTCCNCEGILRKAGSWKAGFEKSSEKEGSWRADFGEKERLLGDVAGRGGGRRKWHGVGRVAVEKRGGVGRRVWDVEKESVESWRGSDREERKESVYEELKFRGKKGSTSRRDEDVEFRRDLDRDDREGSVYEGTDVSRKKVGVRGIDVCAKDSSSRREGYGLRIRDEEENVEDWRDSRREEREGYVQEDKVSRLSDRDKYSNYRNASRVGNVDRGESSSSLVNRRSTVDHQAVVGGAEVRKSSLRNSIVERVTNSQRRFEEERVEDREDRHNLVKNVVQVSGDERTQIDQIIVDRTELSKQYGSRQSDSRFRLSDKEKGSSSDNYVEIKGYGGSSSNSRWHFEEERVKGREDRHNSVKNVVQISGDERTQIDQRIVGRMESNKQYETNRTDSRLHVSDREMANSSKSYLEIKGYNGSSSSSRGHIEEERVEDREHRFSSVKNVVQVMGDERMESDKQKETLQSAYRYLSDKERAITSGSYVEIKEYGGSSSSSQKYRKEERIQGPEDKTTPAEDFVRSGERTQMNQQSIEKMEFDEQNKNQTTTTKIHASGSERADNRKSSLQIADERISNLQELSSTGIKNRKETSSQIKETQIGITGSFHDGSSSALESASRLDESSATYVGEFVGKLREESSAFNSFQVSKEETYRGTNQEATIVELNEGKYREEAGRQSSLGSGMKGPSVEMWEVKGMSSSNQPYKIEDPGEDSSTPEVVGSKTSEITEDTISRRSQRSLWAYIADVMKIGLGHRARSHYSNQKPGTRSSSNESVSSEAWFSGLEPDEDDDEAKKETDTSPKELFRSKQKQLGEQSTQVSLSTSMKSLRRAEQFERGEGETRVRQMHVSGLSKPEEEFGSQKYPEVTGIEGKDAILRRRNSWTKELVPIGSFVEQFHPGPSTSLGSMNTGSPSKEGKMGEKVATSSMDETSGSVSVSIPGIVASSISEPESVKLPGTKSREIEGEIIIEKVPEIGKTDERDGELKRRKLQRSKQAMKEQFDEWEEAYMLEVEQRKMDEFFMREALLEAKKAADTWEVPVGAVLVQNGKIIARGCNLVEELRDSTAHAEIICIREASNFLRTWRLAETILYVTLEPCAMCAGAILQARVGTVVWGAPNKLLGADGSWVRLFPSGDGGTTSSLDPQNQIAGPVHPFHPKITIRRGILATECSEAMQQFFQLRRRKKNVTKPEQPSSPPSCLPVQANPTKLFSKMHDLFCIMFCL